MATTATKLREIRNPAAVGWRWTNTYDGFDGVYEHEITWVRGTWTLLYGTKSPQTGRWIHTPIERPERFGFDGTLKSARTAAHAFYDSDGEEET